MCDSDETRSAGFNLVFEFVKSNPSAVSRVIGQVGSVSTAAASLGWRNQWNHQIFDEIKKSNTDFLGLKNQGCTW